MKNKPKILFFIGVDWFFYSHFFDRAIAAKTAGYDVVVVTSVTQLRYRLADAGIKVINIPMKRRSLNPLELQRNLLIFTKILKQEQPDIVHLVALKPIIIGAISCRFAGVKRVVNAVVGLGFVFTSDRIAARILQLVLTGLFHLVLGHKHGKTVFENKDDLNKFVSKGWVKKENAVLIRGAGIDTEHFRPKEDSIIIKNRADDRQRKPQKVPVAMLVSRMLWDKGVGEFVAAARLLKSSPDTEKITFVLVGDPDEDNRGTIAREQLIAWEEEGVVQWWGYRDDVRVALNEATLYCLPSYREGLPKSLLEAMAMGLPCVATDVPGCREAVVDGHNGFLVPAKDSVTLAHTIKHLVRSSDLLDRFGRASRQMAVDEFSKEIVNEQTLELYRDLIPPQRPESSQ